MLPELKIQPLRCVLAIVDAGGFHAAARQLHRTQPAVSMAVRELEQRLGEFEAALTKNYNPEDIKNIRVPEEDLASDIHASAEYRAHLINVMTRRAISE